MVIDTCTDLTNTKTASRSHGRESFNASGKECSGNSKHGELHGYCIVVGYDEVEARIMGRGENNTSRRLNKEKSRVTLR
jgi:hypothetical protein